MQTSNAAIKKIIGQLREAGSATQTQQIAQNVLELAVAFDAYIIDHDDLIPLELKLNIMEAMSGALLLDKRGRFLKHFVTRIYFFFNKYSLTISEFPQLSSRVIELFRQWKSSEVFAEPFLKKLEKLANSIFLFNTEKPQHFKKYNQNFLMMLKDVQEVEVTNEIYEMLHIKTNALEEVKKISEQAGKFQRVGESQEQRKERLKAMKRDVQNVIESLSHILQLNQQSMEHLKILMLGEQLRLQENPR